MAEEHPDPAVGGKQPVRPAHSLPRYSEPTPETRGKFSREEEAELALKHTHFAVATRLLLIGLFVVTIAFVPTIQLIFELRSPKSPSFWGSIVSSKIYPGSDKIRGVRSISDVWHLLPRAADLKAAEKSIENASVVSDWLLPHVQSVLTGDLHAGNEQIYPGQDAWLFYRPDVDYITGPPFLEPAQMRHRAHVDRVQPDPVKAIVDFRNQLSARSIDLIVMPIPMKPGIDSKRFSSQADETVPLQNPSFLEFKARLESEGIRVFDPGPALIQHKRSLGNRSLYLETDTHWRPETMELVAENLAAMIPGSSSLEPTPLKIVNKEVSALGDVARMLRLPASQDIYRPEQITIHQVLSNNSYWRPNKDAEILLLGDSFSNIYSLDALGWGESAGLAEHLSRVLGGRPLDCILRNSDAAFATREILAHELARGRDRLAHKKLVVWEFAARELASGNWKMIEMKLAEPTPAQFFVPKSGEQVVVSGIVEAVSTAPRPGTVPYRDHIIALHLVDLTSENRGKQNVESVVYLESMHDNVLTAAARLRPGDRVTLRLRPWSDVSEQYEKINRSEIDDPAIQLEEPCWGEPLP